MTSDQLKAAVRAELLRKDAFTSNGAYNTVQAIDILIDEFSGGGGGEPTGGIDDVLGEEQAFTEDHEVDLNGHTFELENGNFYHDLGTSFLFYVQNGDENYLCYVSNAVSNLRSYNSVGENTSKSEVSTSDDSAGFSISSSYNNGEKEVFIGASVQDGEASITYGAGTHTFIGAVILPNSDPGVPGALWNNAGTPAISA